jgi:hypothetical protein
MHMPASLYILYLLFPKSDSFHRRVCESLRDCISPTLHNWRGVTHRKPVYNGPQISGIQERLMQIPMPLSRLVCRSPSFFAKGTPIEERQFVEESWACGTLVDYEVVAAE